MDTVKIDPLMPEENKCPQCGTPLSSGVLAGLCPACLLKMGAADDTVTDAKQPAFIPPSVAELAPLFPQLEILELIGKGGKGAVYKARQKQLDRFVALKILPPGKGTLLHAVVVKSLGMDETAVRGQVHRLRKRFRELLRAEIAQTLSNPAQVDEEMRALFGAFSG